MTRLSLATVGSTVNQLAGSLAIPEKTGVIHIGLGAFHRGHQAYYTDRIIRQGHTQWGIAAINLRSREIVDALRVQDCLYSRWEKEKDNDFVEIISSLTNVLHLPSQRDQVMKLAVQPEVSVITITVSEKGYYFDPETKLLDADHPDIVDDLHNLDRPATLPGLLHAVLEQRQHKDAGPLTLVSCDNYNENGRVLRAVVEGFVKRCHPELLSWMAENVCFPSTMVDGIVPKVSNQDKTNFVNKTGLVDEALVIAENYSRWVIEDNFAGERPRWDLAGAEFVEDVKPYEAMKLHLLNAPHSAIAYLGHSSDLEFIFDAISNPLVGNFTHRLIYNEILPTVTAQFLHDPEPFARKIIPRFSNPNIQHPTRQVASDGSLKIPQRLLPVLEKRLEAGLPVNEIVLAIAGWVHFLSGETDAGLRYDIPDPMAVELRKEIDIAGSDISDLVDRLLALKNIFPQTISSSGEFKQHLIKHVGGLRTHGVLTWLSKIEEKRVS